MKHKHKKSFIAATAGVLIGLGTLGPVSLAQTSSDDELWDLLEGTESAKPADSRQPSTGASQEAAPQEQSTGAASPSEPEPDFDAAPASADAAPATEEPAGSVDTVARPRSSAIEEIVVTAQRREENLQDVPISITVLDQEQISNANITTSADIARYTPSLSANTRFGSDNATFTIRGFTQDLRTTASVGVYFNEVVAPRGQSTQTSGDGAGPGTLFDLQNIQVLKGPQGTLFGRNTTGGAILIVPQRPTDEFEGYGEFTKGDFDALRGQAVVNYPVNDNLRVRFGIDHNKRDGILNNVSGIGPEQQADSNYTAGRLSAVWDITDTLENYTILSMTDSDTNGATSQLYDCNNLLDNLGNPAGYDVPTAINALVQLIQSGGDIDLTNPVPGVPLGGSPLAFLTFPPCEEQLANQQAAGQFGPYDVVNDLATSTTDIEEKRLINTTAWSITDNLTFKNIFAYAHLVTENSSNIFGNRFPDPTDPTGRRVLGIGHSIQRPDMPVTSQETWVEEMQLQGTSFDSRLIWQTGLYYEHSKPDGFSGNSSIAFVYCDPATIETNDPSQFDCFDPLLGLIGAPYRYKVKTEYLNKAAYAQGTWNFSESFGVTLGLRYTVDETEGVGVKEFFRYALTVPQGVTTTIQTPSIESKAPTGILEFNYKPYETVMTYAKYTRGYRQGTVNMLADPGLDTHEPEEVDTYEIGLKSTFDVPFPGRFNVAVFDNTLTNMQLQGGYVSSSSGPTTAIFNAGEGTSQGVEIETSFQPFDPLTVSLSYSKLKTELVETADFCGRVEEVGFIEGFTCTPIAEQGDELPFAPDETYIATLNWTLPVAEEYGRVDVGATYAYTGEQRVASTSSSPYALLDGFGILNLNAGWNGIFGSSYDLNLFATNVRDEEYVIFTTGTFAPLGIESRNLGPPKMIGARLRYNF